MTTIGVFDSGFGGLTVLRALLPLIPSARYIYLGDTARLPYGSKSRETIARYAVSSARFLLDQGADLLVIACNTATALALDDIRTAAHPIPVIGVIEPGAQTAAAHTASAHTAAAHTAPTHTAAAHTAPTHVPATPKSVILSAARDLRISLELTQPPPAQPPPTQASAPTVLVLATAATVQSHAYAEALANLGLPAVEMACPLLVPLVEEGWIDHHVTREVVRIYLAQALAHNPAITTLLLGCTHYPLLRPIFAETLRDLDRPLRIIDSAEATAETVARHLHQPAPTATPAVPAPTFYATDSVEKFQNLGSHFLGQPLPHVHLVDLGG